MARKKEQERSKIMQNKNILRNRGKIKCVITEKAKKQREISQTLRET
jgi:3-methyladenine DNA glycosylase Tag